MARQIVLQPSPVNRREPLLEDNQLSKGNKNRIGEVAGGTAAECAAIWCCCPCAMMHLLILAVYKVPAGLCKKLWRKRRRRKLKKKMKRLQQHQHQLHGGPGCHHDESEMETYKTAFDALQGTTEAVDLEKEMWDHFYGTGFWRSPSQRET